MNKPLSNRARAILVAIFILVAYGVLASSLTQSKIIVMVADAISGLAVIGIASLMFPLFNQLNKPLSRGYLILKYAEGILMITAGVLFLRISLQPMRSMIYSNLHVYVFIISSFMFYYLLYKSRLVPGFISIWGAAGIFALMASTLINLTNKHYSIIDYLLALIITNEVFLALWLMIKGFNKSAIAQKLEN